MTISSELLAELRRFAEELADAAATAIMPHFRAPIRVEDKGGESFDPVTIAGKAAERIMREMILGRYPNHGILGEEDAPVEGNSGLKWVLDPIDGTRAFIAGLPLWGTLIALNDGWDGQDAQNGGAVVACGDPSLHQQLVDRLRQDAVTSR